MPGTIGGDLTTLCKYWDIAEWKAIRRQVLRRDGYRCRVFGCEVRGARNLTVHHMIPRDEGGETYPENLITLCPKHHDEIEGTTARTSAQIQNWIASGVDATPVSSTILDACHEALYPEAERPIKEVHLCQESTLAAIQKLKAGRSWIDLANHLRYPPEYAATLSAISNDKPGAISSGQEDTLRESLGLYPVNAAYVKRCELCHFPHMDGTPCIESAEVQPARSPTAQPVYAKATIKVVAPEPELPPIKPKLDKPKPRRVILRTPTIKCWWQAYGQDCRIQSATYCPRCLGILANDPA